MDVDVVAVAYVNRSLMIGSVSIEAIRFESGTRYTVAVSTGPHRQLLASCDGTAELQQAWRRLADATRARVGRTASGLYIGSREAAFLRDSMVDWRGRDAP